MNTQDHDHSEDQNETVTEPEGNESRGSETVEIPASEHKRLMEEAAEYKDKHLRLLAEFQNAQKRMEREKLEFIKYANEQVIVEFLEILDNLERIVLAAKAKEGHDALLMKGIEMVMGNIQKLLEKHGVKPMTAKGKKFDPHYHEILMQEESSDHEEDSVIEELQKGYLLGEKVVRTAKVKIAVSKKAEEDKN